MNHTSPTTATTHWCVPSGWLPPRQSGRRDGRSGLVDFHGLRASARPPAAGMRVGCGAGGGGGTAGNGRPACSPRPTAFSVQRMWPRPRPRPRPRDHIPHTTYHIAHRHHATRHHIPDTTCHIVPHATCTCQSCQMPGTMPHAISCHSPAPSSAPSSQLLATGRSH
jgi:hypothetical protein